MRPWFFEGTLPLVGAIAIPAYFFWLAAAFIAASFVVVREARRSGEHVPHMLDLAVIVLVGSLVGARLGHVVFENPGGYLRDPLRLLQVWRGGFVYYGGLIFNVMAMAIYIRWRGMSFWRVADICAPAVALGLGIGRLGCLSAGCCFGRTMDWPLGVALPWGVTLASSQVPKYLHDVLLHPTQAYACLLGLALFLWVGLLRNRQTYDGQAFLHLLALYSIGRALVEAFRFDLERGVYLGLFSTSQLLGIPIFLSALIGMRILRQRSPSGQNPKSQNLGPPGPQNPPFQT